MLPASSPEISMTRRTAASCLVALAAALGLTACGEDRGPTVTVNGTKLTPEEVAAGARATEFLKEMRKDGAMPHLPKGDRALTAADVEKFLEVMPEVRKLGKEGGGDITAVGRIAKAHGMSIPEWAIIHTRIIAAAHGLQTGVPYGKEDDAAVVAPFKDRVLQVIRDE
jgi:hypothetical protein